LSKSGIPVRPRSKSTAGTYGFYHSEKSAVSKQSIKLGHPSSFITPTTSPRYLKEKRGRARERIG